MLAISKENQFIPGKVESWIVVLDLDQMSLLRLSIGVVQQVIELLNINFVCTLEKLLIVNPPSSIHCIYKFIESIFIELEKIRPETVSKLKFVSNKYNEIISEFIPKSQLERKYGGINENLSDFWFNLLRKAS